MSCIVGLTYDNAVYIGGDSASLSGYDVVVSGVPKVFRSEPFVIGYTSSWRMGQILQHHMPFDDMEKPQIGDSLQAFMVRIFVEKVREIFTSFGYAKIENNEEKAGQFLVGCYGHLYNIGPDYQVMEVVNGIDACGAGESYALGALYATKSTQLTPFQRLDMALEAAAEFCAAVRPPFHIEVAK